MPDAMTLEAGPELDALVAEAIDMPGRDELLWYGYWVDLLNADRDEPQDANIAWSPSRSMDIAMICAEKAGLFEFGSGDEGSRFLDRVIDGGVVRWRVCAHYYSPTYEGREYTNHDEIKIRPIATAETPELAICRAILKLKAAP